MWFLASAILLVTSLAVQADPQGYNYLPPQNPLPLPCNDVTSVINTVQYRNQVIPTTINRVSTQYRSTIVYNQRVVPTTLYNTQVRTKVQVQTSVIQRDSQVNREQVVTKTNRGQNVVQTRYETSVRIVPQISYVTKEQVRTQVVPVEITNTRVETRFRDQVQFQTRQVQSTTVIRVPGRNIQSTIYNTQTQTSVIQNQQPAQTRYRTTTAVRNQIQTQTIPSPPVIRTSVVNSQRVIRTTVVRTNFQNRFETSIVFATKTQVQTQTQIRTQAVPQEVVVTREVVREVVRTQYRTQVVRMTQLQTRYETNYNTGANVVRTQQIFVTSTVRQPGADRVITRQVVNTQQRQEVRYVNQNVNRQATVTRTVTATCGGGGGGYNYPEPATPFRF